MIIFDVGVNDGRTFFNRLSEDVTVYAFEPTKELIDKIKEWCSAHRNFILVESAVAETDGYMDLNVAGHHDWGCTSLLEFNPDLDKTWPGRPDFYVSHIQKDTKVTRLDTFLLSHPEITSIDYLHIDIQGTDLQVLRSLGDKISMVKKGCMETSTSNAVSLYKNQHTLSDCREFLERNGFKITSIASNDVYNNEVNVFFERS